ncbi:MAG: hypothetical protein LPK19_00020, partial [Hymenobacteraceae bacterium]|nr:hypothetical protein [Hymenobacteraceae bacterium]MDX5510578.1 hypothetical protein [Hymenobacteraceae bacterium]
MKKLAKILSGILIVFIGVNSWVKNIEPIPENAMVDVFPSQGYWLPHNTIIYEDMKQLLANPESAEETKALLSEITPATWYDIKKGKYKNFNVHPAWKEFDNYNIGMN